ncbi:hypothetical protein C8J57DRAFT_1480495 [Mycena rebaudengoi]|nr:hypothetical protein C8J57DRAFT_1480495 [Mycena rebaudengoi]
MVGIWDFNKKNAFNLVNSACNDYTPVNIRLANFEPINQWVLAGGPFTFQFITRCGTFLTYPNQFCPLAVANQATTRPTASATTSWMVSLVDPATPTGPWNILEPTSGAALTAWSQDPAQVVNSGAPITLEVANAKDTRQQFWFTSSVGTVDILRDCCEQSADSAVLMYCATSENGRYTYAARMAARGNRTVNTVGRNYHEVHEKFMRPPS